MTKANGNPGDATNANGWATAAKIETNVSSPEGARRQSIADGDTAR